MKKKGIKINAFGKKQIEKTGVELTDFTATEGEADDVDAEDAEASEEEEDDDEVAETDEVQLSWLFANGTIGASGRVFFFSGIGVFLHCFTSTDRCGITCMRLQCFHFNEAQVLRWSYRCSRDSWVLSLAYPSLRFILPWVSSSIVARTQVEAMMQKIHPFETRMNMVEKYNNTSFNIFYDHVGNWINWDRLTTLSAGPQFLHQGDWMTGRARNMATPQPTAS